MDREMLKRAGDIANRKISLAFDTIAFVSNRILKSERRTDFHKFEFLNNF